MSGIDRRSVLVGGLACLTPLALQLVACRAAPTPIASPSASMSVGSSSGPVCSSVELKLEVTRNRAGSPQRAYVVVKESGEERLMWLDTGTRASHTYHPVTGSKRPIPEANRVEIGCLSLSLDSWPTQEEAVVNGLTSIGSIGVDFLTEHVTVIDLDAERMVRQDIVPATDPNAWVRLPVEIVNGLIVTQAVVNGRPTRLLVDTGVWILTIVDPDLDDSAGTVHVRDFAGKPLTFVRGESTLELAGAPPRRVADWRTHEFTAFTRHGLGPEVEGMLGLSSFGASQIVFDLPNREIRYLK